MSFKTDAWRRVLRTIRRNSGTPLVNRIRDVANAVYRAASNPAYEFASNGELRVMRIVTGFFDRKVVFDVGANVGHWSLAVAENLASADRIYAFEPSSRTFAKLQANTASRTNIHCFNLGLSGSDCTMEMAHSDSNPEKSSVELFSAESFNDKILDYRRETQTFRAGDGFCRDHSVDKIAFLKIDTEGHDYHVLEGFIAMLASGGIQVIQFEYNRLNIYTKTLLHDFYALLNPADAEGFAIGRIYPNTVQFKDYSPLDENFIDGNFLAVRRSLLPLIKRLQP